MGRKKTLMLSADEKRAILHELQAGEISTRELARKHSVGESTIYAWKNQYGNEKGELDGEEQNPTGAIADGKLKPTGESIEILTLIGRLMLRIQELEKELGLLRP